MRKLMLVALSVLVVAVFSGPAGGTTASDPNDADGVFDMEKIGIVYDSGTGVLTLKIRTFHGWGCRYLRQSQETALNWYFDDGEDGDNDLIGKFVCVKAGKNPTLIFKLHGTDSGNNYESLKAKRPNHHTVTVKMPTDLTELEAEHMRVHARSSNGVDDGCDSTCVDRAPDTGGVRAY